MLAVQQTSFIFNPSQAARLKKHHSYLIAPRFHKTRIAPTPSGYLHLGNVFSFVVTAGLARKHNAAILLRIDDLDRDRVRTSYVQDIFDTLRFLGIPWDEGPRDIEEYANNFSQQYRLPLYNEALEHLRKNDAVFGCECSRSQLLETTNVKGYPGTCIPKKLSLYESGCNWRLFTNNENKAQVKDVSGKERQYQLPGIMDYFVVRKKDNRPAYQLASVVDDLFYGVDLIVRGEDLWNSTLAQLYLSQLLPHNDFAKTTFYHHPVITQPGGKKLSKSAGDTSVQFLRMQGHTAPEIFTGIATALGCQEPLQNWHALFAWYSNAQGLT